ncbi:MAG: hypothetical protein J5809_00480 [Selenomonadaceae bacterium]|nr:hypothetical protein [Selenomonadaceae bacterium]
MRKRHIIEDDEEIYIPDIGDTDEEIDIHGQYPRSNAGIALDWSPLEQQIFDLLFLNRFAKYDREVLDEAAKEVIHLVKTFKSHEIARIASIALMSFQLSESEGKSFEEEYKNYKDYIRKHPEDAEEVR